MLEEDLEDSLVVGEEFLQSVMAHLPQEPPRRPRTKTTRRSLKLA
jgi:hypothetical protein